MLIFVSGSEGSIGLNRLKQELPKASKRLKHADKTKTQKKLEFRIYPKILKNIRLKKFLSS